jgi:hypothetical protein
MALIRMNEGNQNTIFVVAVIKTELTDGPATYSLKEDRIRTVAWTVDVSDAIRIVSDDIGQISDAGYYNLALVEELAEGVYNMAINQWWFQWNDKDEKYYQINKPERFNLFGRISM